MVNYYWDNFYKKNFFLIKPSSFAKFVKKKFIKKNFAEFLEIGCGNARDTIYFNKERNLNILAIDKSEIIIKQNIFKKNKLRLKNLNFLTLDILNKNFKNIGKFKYIYSRFFLHSINEKTENHLLKNLLNITINKSIIMFEFRTLKDKMINEGKVLSFNERYTDHYRRFIIVEKLFEKIKNLKKFKIIFFKEAKNLAKYKNENPVVCRVILKRNKQ